MMKKMQTATKKVSFTLEAPEARSVFVAGDFNGWDSDRTQLRKGRRNIWQRDIRLKSGRYEYKFLVDGNWMIDPNNNNRIWNSFGSENSVLEI